MKATFLIALFDNEIKKNGLSLRGAAEKIGVSHTTVQRILAGQQNDLETLISIANWLGVSPANALGTITDDEKAKTEKIKLLLSRKPELAKLFYALIESIENGEKDEALFEDIIAYFNFRMSRNVLA